MAESSVSAEGAKRILIVEDDVDTRTMLSLRLQREGYTVLPSASGAEALDGMRREGIPNLVLLDIMLPDMDGFAVAEELRNLAPMPIIFLSAISDTDRKVEGISLYAEDYITKPFAFSELLARVKRVLARTTTELSSDPEQVIDDHLRINFAQHYAVVDGEQLTLTPTETRLMHILYNNRGRVLSAGFLLAKAWEPVHRGTVESLWVHVRRLRNKIEPDPDHPRYVVTVRGQGYCLPQRTRPVPA
jgi:DNA-binding response OmpR family regulator